MKKTSFGIERALYRKIKNMKREELDQYLYKVSSRSESYGYEDGLKNGIALSSKCMDEAIQKAIGCTVIDGIVGYETIEKTKQYQMKNNLQIDGIARNQDQSQDISKWQCLLMGEFLTL